MTLEQEQRIKDALVLLGIPASAEIKFKTIGALPAEGEVSIACSVSFSGASGNLSVAADGTITGGIEVQPEVVITQG